MSEYLAKNLHLSIERLDETNEIQITLTDNLGLDYVTVCYPINQGSPQRPERLYHVSEAIVIAMRRVVGKAMEEGLILNHPGLSTSSNSGGMDTSTPSTKSSIPDEFL